jgi:hypothetical protein
MLKKQGRVLCFSADRKISLPPKQRKGRVRRIGAHGPFCTYLMVALSFSTLVL